MKKQHIFILVILYFNILFLSTFVLSNNVIYAACSHEYKYESQGNGRHTIYCKKCGSRFGQGTCTSNVPGECSYCGKGSSGGNSEKVDCDHEFGDWKISTINRNEHIKYCIFGCESYKIEKHTFKNGQCTCGLKEDGTCNHKLSDWKKVDNYNHEQKCLNDCGMYSREPHSYNFFTRKCICGFTKYDNCDHTFTPWIYTEPTSHSRSCTKCSFKETQSHVLVWAIESFATCTVEGLKVYKCAYCSYIGDKETQSIPKISHKYNSLGICTECGYENKLVAFCTSNNKIASHVYTSPSYKKLDDTSHELTETCRTCNLTFTKVASHTSTETNIKCICGFLDIKKCSHSYGMWNNSSSAGHTRECMKCLSSQTLPHTYIWRVTQKPTCSKEGQQEQICVYCGNISNNSSPEPVKKSNHIFNASGTCMLCGIPLEVSNPKISLDELEVSISSYSQGYQIPVSAEIGANDTITFSANSDIINIDESGYITINREKYIEKYGKKDATVKVTVSLNSGQSKKTFTLEVTNYEYRKLRTSAIAVKEGNTTSSAPLIIYMGGQGEMANLLSQQAKKSSVYYLNSDKSYEATTVTVKVDKANEGNMKRAMDDTIKYVQELVTEGKVDPTKISVVTYSYGGYGGQYATKAINELEGFQVQDLVLLDSVQPDYNNDRNKPNINALQEVLDGGTDITVYGTSHISYNAYGVWDACRDAIAYDENGGFDESNGQFSGKVLETTKHNGWTTDPEVIDFLDSLAGVQ